MDRYDDDYDDGPAYADPSFHDAPVDGDDTAMEPSASDDAIEHLWTAAHELLRAVRMIVDAADEFVSSQRGAISRRLPHEQAPSERGPRVRRIDIDDHEGGDCGDGREGADDRGDQSSGWPGTPGAAPR